MRHSYLFNSSSSSEEEVPLRVCNLFSLPHDVHTQHEGEHQLVLLKQTPEEIYFISILHHVALNSLLACLHGLSIVFDKLRNDYILRKQLTIVEGQEP